MSARAQVTIVITLVLFALPSCQSRQERELELTEQCKRDTPCKKQGLCTGLCTPEPCRCVVGSSGDCVQSAPCEALGQCTVKDGKCVVASNADCARTAGCKASGFCTAKDGICVAGSDADCQKSELCKASHKCAAKSDACIDATFNPALLNPALTNEKAPEKFKVKFTTTKGDFVVEVMQSWAPLGAERLYNLVKIGYYANIALFNVDGSTAEFGIHGNPEVSAAWREASLRDEPPRQPNDRGNIAFAKSRPHSRWAPLVVHLKNNRDLDQVGYVPIGRVIQGMSVLDSLSKAQREGAKRPDPVKLETGGDAYLKASFPQVDYVTSAVLL
jgi:peptidyl-prolyl cis-trans isomerase A (cyclophilin A)